MLRINFPIITFLTPTLGRETLARSLKSIDEQPLKEHLSIVCFDGISPTISETPRRRVMSCLPQKNAGPVRNIMLPLVQTKWIGFLDDDDMLTPDAMEIIKNNSNSDLDLILFRLLVNKGRRSWTHPKSHINGIGPARLGDLTMSFIIKKEFVDLHTLRFNRGIGEDFKFLKEADRLGAKSTMLETPIYFVDRSGRWR